MGEAREIAPPPAGATARAPSEVSATRLLFRFAVGGTGLLAEWLGAALRAIDELPTPPDGRPAAVEVDARVVIVGALSSAMRRRLPTPLEAAARSTGRATRRALRVLAHVPGAGLVERRYRHLRADAAAQLRRWAEEGARETLAGRRLARLASPGFFELAVARAAESPELKMVIEEQSQGLAASSVAELRERSEAADRAVERVVRRVLGRDTGPP